MATRGAPADQGLNGKAVKKGDPVSDIRKISRDRRSSNGSAEGRATSDDVAVLTVSAELLEQLENALASVPSVDSSRVAEIKTAIEKGDYKIDADAIADAMIRLDRSFGE